MRFTSVTFSSLDGMVKKRSFTPAKGIGGPHLQTLYASLIGRGKIENPFRERFELEDGDFVDSFWYQKPSVKGDPIVTLFHGLAGSWKSAYICRTMRSLSKRGFSVVLMHFRGCSGVPNRLPRSYHAAHTADAKAWISYLKRKYPASPLLGVGFSLGGNMLLKLLGEWGGDSPLRGAAVVSAPMRLDLTAWRMERGISRFYRWYLLRELKAAAAEKYSRHDMQARIGLTLKELKKLRTFWEFDDAYTATLHGFADVRTYYERAGAASSLKKIETPTLILHARDDPFTGEEVIPSAKEISPAIELEITENGGHLGFVGGSLRRPRFWMEERVGDFLIQCLENSD